MKQQAIDILDEMIENIDKEKYGLDFDVRNGMKIALGGAKSRIQNLQNE